MQLKITIKIRRTSKSWKTTYIVIILLTNNSPLLLPLKEGSREKQMKINTLSYNVKNDVVESNTEEREDRDCRGERERERKERENWEAWIVGI